MVRDWKQWEGEVIDGTFPLHRYLGGSGQSAVFLTEHGEPPVKAAIKLVHDGSADAELLSRWRRAAELSHRHLIRLFCTGTSEVRDTGVLYAVMEYAEEDIALVLGDRCLTPVETAEMLEPVVQALSYIHERGLAHGHLKPGNIMAVGDQLKISSDGICEAGELRSYSKSSGPYDPPELAVAGASKAGDIWSLGMVLVEALTRQFPRPEGPGGEMVLPETMPAVFVVAARGCLQEDPKRRAPLEYITSRLERASSPPEPLAPLPSREPFKPQPPDAPPQKRRYPVLLAGIGLALAAVLAGPRLLRHPEPSAASPSPPAKVEPSPVRAPAPLPTEPKGNPAAALTPPAVLPPAASPVAPQTTPAVVPPPAPPREGASKASAAVVPPAAPPPESASKATDAPASGDVARRVLPEVLPAARASITGKVKVAVRAAVDASGKVTAARLESPGPSKYFSRVSVQAANRWQFHPPKVQGRDVPSEWLLRFEYTTKGTEVSPRRVSP